MQNYWAANTANSNLLSTNHPLRTWGTAATQKINTWEGITITNDRITTINLRSESLFQAGILGPGINGNIPTQLGNLTNLTQLYLDNNLRLTGPIPTQLGNLTNLTLLDLSHNQITGPIPTQLGNLTNLTLLDLYGNQITGPIPTQLGNLTNLTDLELIGNRLTGNIPTQLGQLTNLDWLGLSGNQITGPIPTQLGNLTNLTSLNLSGNRLTGNIPTQLGQLTNLDWLGLSGNQITGPIPTQLGNLTNLTSLRLNDNQLTGNIPTQLGSLANLIWLRLSNNQITGSIPTQLGQLTNLSDLHLNGNQLTGNIPAQLGNLANLTELWLHNNWLSGSIPAELGNLAPYRGGSLATFDFCNNYLTGAVPAALRSGINLYPYPTDEGYDPVACQNTGSPPAKTPSTIPAVVVPFAPPPATDPPPPSTTTTTTTAATTIATTTTTVPSTPTATTAVPVTLEPDRPGPRWNTLAVQRGGTTASQIRQTLRLSSGYNIYTWDTNTRTWTRTTRPDQPIPPSALIAFRSEKAPDPDDLDRLNLARGTRRPRLAQGWNLISVPASTARSDDNPDFLFAAQLTNCENPQGILAIANYSARTRQWSLSLPCHPATQARLTTGDNPPYQPLTSISPADTTYIYTRANQPLNIAWNPQTRTYQPS